MSAAVDARAATSVRRSRDGSGDGAAVGDPNDPREQLLARLTSEERLMLVCELCRRLPPLSGFSSSGGGSAHLFLLACLHSCCHECVDQMSAASAVTDVDDDYGPPAADASKSSHQIGDRYSDALPNRSRAAAQPASSGRLLSSVFCPTCGMQTNHSELKHNAFAETRLRTLLATMNSGGAVPLCSVCSDRSAGAGGNAATMTAAAAQYWCPQCGKHMCFSCRKRHDVFKREHHVVPASSTFSGDNSDSGNQRAAASDVAAVAVVRCAAHAGAACDFYCADCESLRCSECVKACAAERHETGAVGRPRAEGHAMRIADALRAELANLRTKALPRADACADMQQLLVAARRRDEDRARKIKKEAIETTLRACDLARSELAAMYGALTGRARQLEAETGDLLALISTIADASDVRTTLKHRKALLSYVARFENELEQIATELNVPLIVANDGSRSSGGTADAGYGWRSMVNQSCVESSEEGREFVCVVERWIGWPREHRGFPLVPEESRPASGEPFARRHGYRASPERQQEQFQQKQQPQGHGASPEHQREQQQQQQQPLPSEQLQQQAVTTAVSQQQPLIPRGETQPPPSVPPATDACSADPPDPATGTAAAASVEPALVFNDTDDCFGLSVECRDVAMTSDGRVLLAALKHGLKHFAPDGRKLPTWRPGVGADGGPAIVSSVDVLAGGDGTAGDSDAVVERVVVSLIDVQRVVILRREVATRTTRATSPSAKPEDGSGVYRGSYVEERLVDLTTSPFRVSAFGCRFAVAGAHVTDNRESRGYHVVVGRHWSPGPHVELYRVPPSPPLLSPASAPAFAASGGCTLELQQKFEHDVISLAIADSFLVTLSQRPATSSGVIVYMLEAIDFVGTRLWCKESRYELLDICTAPQPPPQLTISCRAAAASAPPVLYATMPRRDRVCAYSISGDRCQLLVDVLIGGGGGMHTLTSPGRLSLGYRRVASADGVAMWLPALAVLIAQNAVAVFVAQPPAAASAADAATAPVAAR